MKLQMNAKYRLGSPRLRVWLAGLIALLCPAALMAQSPCDLNADGSVNTADVSLAVQMALGQTPCSGNVSGTGTCNVAAVQRVVNGTVSGTCSAGKTHSVVLSWVPSVSPTVTGYSVYRATASGGPFVKLTTSPVAAASYTDHQVRAGTTYYYAVTSTDDFGNESFLSTVTSVSVPFP
jgi:hypothetical protein